MRVRVNGIDFYYQKLGEGAPLVLVHGHHLDSSMYDKIVVPLSLYYTVYTFDMRGHGLSAGEPAPHYETEVADLAGLLKAWGIAQPYCFAFGAGGIVALKLAAQDPHAFKKIIVAGTFVNGGGVKTSRYFTEGIKRFLARNRDSRVELTENYLSEDTLRQIQPECLCVVGERDWVKIEHVRLYSQLLPHGRLVIMPRQSHERYAVHSLKILDLIKDFFKQEEI